MSASSNHDAPEPDSPRDSALGDCRSRTSSTTTITGKCVIIEEYGRTYHNYPLCRYLFPNDNQEKDRLDLQHQMLLILLDQKLFLAPILDEPQKILDVGTGTGIWAIEVAYKYPSACVLGIDISHIQPSLVPPGCYFELDDANEAWESRQDFDFIHCRLLHMAVEEKELFRKSVTALKEGGWFEIKDFVLELRCNDGTLKGTALLAWGSAMMEALKKVNIAVDRPHEYGRWMKEAGFIDIKKTCYLVPLNTWPKDSKLKEVGRWQMANLLEGLEGFSLALFIQYLGWSKEELEVFLARVREDIKNPRIHAYMTLVCVTGKKPGREGMRDTIPER